MARYLARRVLQAVGVILAIAAITFFVLNVVPGDPVRVMMGDQAKEEAVQQVRHELGLDRPVGEQFVLWLGNVVRGDLGSSYGQHRSVAGLIAQALGYTARLAIGAMLLASVVGLVFGLLAATFRDTWVDRTLMALAVAGISAPAFWMAVVLQLVFALGLRCLPLSGTSKPFSFVLPTVALGVRMAASIARVTRTSMLDVLGQDYMTTALAKGASRRRMVLSHGLKNALVPIITIVGTQIGDVFAGSVLVETVFGIPGVGSLLLTAINQRDLPLIEGGVMYVAAVCVVAYLACDVLYAAVDPRIRLDGRDAPS
mgnify:CR=1 FL=1